MAELQDLLQDLGRLLQYPPTPDLSSAVRARIDSAQTRTRWWERPAQRRTALAIAVVIIALAASTALLSPVRDTLARFFHVPGVVIERQAVVPSPTPGGALQLGTPTSLNGARTRLNFPVALPTTLAVPSAVYLSSVPPGGELSLVYAPAPGLPEAHSSGVGLLLTEFRGTLAPQFFGKILGPGTLLKEVDVAGTRGYWITGSPHAFFYQQVGGNPTDEPLRLADNTLLWEKGGVTFRIESGLDLDAALRVANGIH
ncbi:MAG: hypothetical protein ACYDGR_15790 [Candidatus Dormibacteria bacterium]